jgi:hypothetical protein
MAKLKWADFSGRGYGCGGGGIGYHYGKTSGTERTLLYVAVLRFMKATAPNGQTACLIQVRKSDDTKYWLAAEGKLGDVALKHLKVWSLIHAVVKPTGGRTLLIKDLVFAGSA